MRLLPITDLPDPRAVLLPFPVPELPDITVFAEALRRRVTGQILERVRIFSPALLRTFDPAIDDAEGKQVTGVSRLGKRIVLRLNNQTALVIHLMIAGRFRWSDQQATASKKGKINLAQFVFGNGTLTLTEASQLKRASLHCVRAADLDLHDPKGLDVLSCTPPAFAQTLQGSGRTLKRALTDPRLIDGIGNAYSDEILHAARLSPTQRATNLGDDELLRLHAAAKSTLEHWTKTLLLEFGLNDPGSLGRFPGPGDITAFRPDFAVHGKFRKPCPVCGTPVQRIVYAENECNYCPKCQTGGKVLADRSLSRLLKDDWPRTMEELEAL